MVLHLESNLDIASDARGLKSHCIARDIKTQLSESTDTLKGVGQSASCNLGDNELPEDSASASVLGFAELESGNTVTVGSEQTVGPFLESHELVQLILVVLASEEDQFIDTGDDATVESHERLVRTTTVKAEEKGNALVQNKNQEEVNDPRKSNQASQETRDTVRAEEEHQIVGAVAQGYVLDSHIVFMPNQDEIIEDIQGNCIIDMMANPLADHVTEKLALGGLRGESGGPKAQDAELNVYGVNDQEGHQEVP
jgi:hypothetical protein